MIRHIVLFKFNPGIGWDHPEAIAAERSSQQVGDRVPQLLQWRTGRNISERSIAYDFVAIGLLQNEEALMDYLNHPFHRKSSELWKKISSWVIADLTETGP
ncbi:Dabb family protein [Streptomyces sp. NPDC058086]|uniref:Dabb family protein n=1 Tax=Streptomyces sp. NPDC058086 TaxID=3346334 RepID=UPI0036E73B06